MNIAITACVIAAAWLAVSGSPHWGWFLVVGFLLS
jgi:hypothetical protein